MSFSIFGELPKKCQYSLQLFLLFQVFRPSGGMFFHERSNVILAPKPGGQETFGFSLAYQKGSKSLVTGAPHSGRTGKVFKCPLREVLKKKSISCVEAPIDVGTLAPYSKEFAPDLKLNLGYSVSTTDNSFFTCAPLWPGDYNISIGTCFLYDDTAHRYETFVETQPNITMDQTQVGHGWRTLVDTDWLLSATVAVAGRAPADVAYARRAQAPMRSLTADPRVFNHLENYRNVGFSIAAGKFFSNQTVYAISSLDKYNRGAIHFLEPTTPGTNESEMLELAKVKDSFMIVEDKYAPGFMFGAAMCSANLNYDERADLVVGVPAWGDKEEGSYDSGAVYIYLGGEKFQDTTDVIMRRRKILGNRNEARFGTAIAASDLDGDFLSEIFVGAPYESSEEGALYIFSGLEIYEKLIKSDEETISITQLNLSQRIRMENFKTFGYSLQVIPDMDGNGCDELAVGSPKSENVIILRSLPSVNVTVDAERIGDELGLDDTKFVVRVYVGAQDYKNRSLSLSLILKHEVVGKDAVIKGKTETSIKVNVNDPKGKDFEDILVQLDDTGLPGEYLFQTSIHMDETGIMNAHDFDTTWALISPYSDLKKKLSVERRCKDADCNPKFTMHMHWPDGTIVNGSYFLGSSESLSADLVVTNEGHSTWDACAVVTVSGATVAQSACSVDGLERYKCQLPTGLRKGIQHTISIKLDMRERTNAEGEIKIHVDLHDVCDRPNNTVSVDSSLKLNLNTNDVTVTGTVHQQKISDTQILDKIDNQFKTAHNYWVTNSGNITWKNIVANVTVYKQPFMNSSRVADWLNEEFPDKTVFHDSFDLLPGATKQVIVTTDIIKNNIMENLRDNRLSVQSSFVLYLHPTTQMKEKSLSSIIVFQKEMGFGSNKNIIILVGIILGLLALAVFIFVLYKLKFFKSSEKEKLEELQQQVKNRGTSAQQRSDSARNEGLDELEMEIEDDDAFEIVDMSTPVLPEDTPANKSQNISPK